MQSYRLSGVLICSLLSGTAAVLRRAFLRLFIGVRRAFLRLFRQLRRAVIRLVITVRRPRRAVVRVVVRAILRGRCGGGYTGKVIWFNLRQVVCPGLLWDCGELVVRNWCLVHLADLIQGGCVCGCGGGTGEPAGRGVVGDSCGRLESSCCSTLIRDFILAVDKRTWGINAVIHWGTGTHVVDVTVIWCFFCQCEGAPLPVRSPPSSGNPRIARCLPGNPWFVLASSFSASLST